MKTRLLSAAALAIFIIIILSAAAGKSQILGNQGPVASFTYSPSAPMPGEPVVFDASLSYDPDGRITTFAWDFGDGITATMTTPTVSHVFLIDGAYTIELAVIDNGGASDSATAVVQVSTVVFFRVVISGTTTPLANAKVTAYYKNGATWTAITPGPSNMIIKYDNMTQPHLSSTAAEKYRNPGYTASILRSDASNIGFDIYPGCWDVYFKIAWGSYVTYWPNETTRVFSYKNGAVEQHNYASGHRAIWDSSASTYVIKVNDIPGDGVSPTESHPIIVGILCPPPPVQYYLTVNTNPIGLTTIPGQGWYSAGTNVPLAAPDYANVTSNSRYRFSYWDVDGVSQGGGVNPITVTMTANHTATAHYVLQYAVVFNQNGLASDATGTILSVNGTTKVFGDMSFTYWVDVSSSVVYSYSATVASSVTGKQYRLNSITGSSSPIIVAGSTTICGNYVAQYLITFAQIGLDATATGTVVTVNGVPKIYVQLPYSFWVDSGTSITYSYSSPVTGSTLGKRFRLSSVSGTGSPFLATAPMTVTGNYVVQYLVTFAQTGLDSTASGTIVAVNSNPQIFSALPHTLWVDSGGSVTYSYNSVILSSVSGKQFLLLSVTGSSSPLTITSPTNVTGNYKTQYYLTVFSPYDSPTPASGWFDSGSSITESVTTPVSGPTGTRYVCTGWTGTGSIPASGSGSSVTFTIAQPSSITWNWKTQFQIAFSQTGVGSDFTGTIVTVDTIGYNYGSLPSVFWFDSGSSHTFSYGSPLIASANAKKYVWLSTTGLSSVQSGSIAVTATGSIAGNYKTQFYLTVSSAYDSPTPASGWFDSGSSITESVTTPVSGPTGTRYVCTGWTGTGNVPSSGTGASVVFTITQPSSITWTWKTQYYLTVSSAYDSPTPASGWFDSGSSVTESVTTPAPGPLGTQYVCTGWTGTGNVPSSGSGSTVTFTITQPSSITWNWKTQYQVTFTHTGLDASTSGTVATVNGAPITYTQLPYTVWVDSGNSIVYAYNNASSSNIGKRFVLIGVTGSPSPAAITNPMTITGNYKTQYQVTFSQTGVGSDYTGTTATVDSNGYTVSSLPVSFWWDDSSSHTFSFISPLIVNASEQYSWLSTSGLTTLQSGSLSITASGSVTGNYAKETKLQVTFGQIGLNSDFTGTVITIDGTNYGMSGLPASFWWNSGSVHTFSYQSPLLVSPNGKRYVWTSTTGLSPAQSGSITVSGSGSVIGNYKTQYFLTLETNPPSIATPSGAGWYDAGTNATIDTPAFVNIVPGSSRSRFNGWTTGNMSEITDPSRSPTTVTVDEGKTVTATYVTQYAITFNQSGAGSDFAYAIAMIDTIDYNYSVLPTQFMWDDNTVHSFEFKSPLVVTVNAKRYIWTGTTGLSSKQSDTITVTTYGSIVGNYRVQYYLAVGTNPPGITTILGEGWYNDSASVMLTGPAVPNYTFDRWYVNGVPQGAGVNPIIITMNSAYTAQAYYNPIVPYVLTITTTPGGTTNPVPGAYNYSSGQTVQVMAIPNSGYVLDHWELDGTNMSSSNNPLAVTMNANHNLKAVFTAAPSPPTVIISPASSTMNPGQSIQFTSTVTGGKTPYQYQWYLDGTPVPGATSSTWTFIPTTNGIHYVQLKVTDALNNTVFSETARVTVSNPVPIGGYAISYSKQRQTLSIAMYMLLLGVFCAVLTSFKRKKKQQPLISYFHQHR